MEISPPRGSGWRRCKIPPLNAHISKKGETEMKIVNLTPHALNFLDAENRVVLTVPSSGVARAAQRRESIGTIDADGVTLSVTRSKFGAVEGLPAEQDGVIYVVLALTAQAVSKREGVFIVDDSVRDENGRIIGVRGLAHV